MGMTEKQLSKVSETLGIDSEGIAADAAAILDAHGPDVDVEGRALAPADQAEVGDLVAIYGTGRHRIARVWATTKGKVSAYYVTPSAVNDRVRAGLPMSGVNYMSVTANRSDAYMFRAFGDVPLADLDDDEPDREPSAMQEEAWDSREDDARGHATTGDEPEQQTYVEPSTLQQWQAAARDDEAQTETIPGISHEEFKREVAATDEEETPEDEGITLPALADKIDEGSEQTGDDDMDAVVNGAGTQPEAGSPEDRNSGPETPVEEPETAAPSVYTPADLALPTRTMTALQAVQSGKYGARAAHIAERVCAEGIDNGQRATRIVGHLRMALYAANEMRAGDAIRLVPEAMAETATA